MKLSSKVIWFIFGVILYPLCFMLIFILTIPLSALPKNNAVQIFSISVIFLIPIFIIVLTWKRNISFAVGLILSFCLVFISLNRSYRRVVKNEKAKVLENSLPAPK
ncbi:MAG: hypothetical protein WCI77_07730 [Candidatus Omnitrophota bacterium]